MLNVYTFHGTLTSEEDHRIRKEINHHQEATSLSQAWDLTEEHLAKEYPNTITSLSVGNRQPIQLRPGFKLSC